MASAVTEKPKRARFEARVSEEIKALAEQAAALTGLSLTDFVVQSVREKAEQVMEQYQIIRLTAEESKVFADVILNQTEPNEALKEAAERYRQMFGRLP